MGAKARRNDPEGVRQRVIDAAYRAFTTQGYRNTAVHDLQREAGVSGGAFSHHFPTKRKLALAVIRDRVRAAVEETWIAPVRSAATAAEGIGMAFDGVIAELRGQGHVSGCPLNNLVIELARENGEIRAAMDSIFESWREAIAEKLRLDVAAGRLQGIEPDAAATFVVAAYSGGMAMAKSAQDAAPLQVCAGEINGYLARQTPRGTPPAEGRPLR